MELNETQQTELTSRIEAKKARLGALRDGLEQISGGIAKQEKILAGLQAGKVRAEREAALVEAGLRELEELLPAVEPAVL